MRLDNSHCTEVEILSFNARCKIDEMSYEQTVNVRISDGTVIRLFDFMGFAVNESRLGKGKRLILCIRHIDGDIEVLESGTPHLAGHDFDPETEEPTRLRLVARVLEVSEKDHDLLIDAGFGDIYVVPDEDVTAFSAGDIITFTAARLDLLEILE